MDHSRSGTENRQGVVPVLDRMLSNAWHQAMTSIGIFLVTSEHSTRSAVLPGGPVESSRKSLGAHATSDFKELII